MGPKRGKKRNKDKDDDDFGEDIKGVSKWAAVLQQEEPDAEVMYGRQEKQIFDYDFSNQEVLYEKKQPVHHHRDKYADFTPEQLQQVRKMKEKAKNDQEVKNKIKNQKRKERKIKFQAKKEKQDEEKAKEQEQLKKIEAELAKNKKSQNSLAIPISLFTFLVLMIVLQYHEEIHAKLSRFQRDDIDYYEVMEIDQGATDKDVKQKYKKLVLKYHPDRNQDCENCKEKFDQIMEAWQILGNPEKRQSYDRTRGVIDEIKSSSITLTPRNYNYLVTQANKIWLIQVYDSTNSYARYFNQFWEDAFRQYSDIINFGRIDSWTQPEMLSYVPYRFQIFPGLYILDRGYSQMCNMDFQKPLNTMRKCIEDHLEKVPIDIIPTLPPIEELRTKYENQKVPIKITAKLRNSPRVRAINIMYNKYFEFYFVEQDQKQRNLTAYTFSQNSVQPENHEFIFAESSKKSFLSYRYFLQSLIVQKLSICQFNNICQQRKCGLILNQTDIPRVRNHLSLHNKINQNSESLEPILMVYLKDGQTQLPRKIQQIKIATQVFQNFQIGAYENGRIQLGYVDEIAELDPSTGELLNLTCKIETWTEWVIRKISKLFD